MHNYLKKIQELKPEALEVGTVWKVNVAHDDWCGVYKGRECNCDPDIQFERLDEDD